MAFLYLPIWCRFRGWEGQVGGGVVFICTSYGYMILHTLFFIRNQPHGGQAQLFQKIPDFRLTTVLLRSNFRCNFLNILMFLALDFLKVSKMLAKSCDSRGNVSIFAQKLLKIMHLGPIQVTFFLTFLLGIFI